MSKFFWLLHRTTKWMPHFVNVNINSSTGNRRLLIVNQIFYIFNNNSIDVATFSMLLWCGPHFKVVELSNGKVVACTRSSMRLYLCLCWIHFVCHSILNQRYSNYAYATMRMLLRLALFSTAQSLFLLPIFQHNVASYCVPKRYKAFSLCSTFDA